LSGNAILELLESSPWLVIGLWCLALLWMAKIAQALLKKTTERLARESSTTGIVISFSGKALPWVFLFFGWAVVLHSADDQIAHIDLFRRLNSLLLIVAFSMLASRAVSGLGEAIVKKHPYDIADNYRARGILTQTRVLTRTLSLVIVVIGVSAGLMVFPEVRKIGTALLASAGVLGLAVGLAAKPIVGNLLAGLQIAFTQPIRLDDVVIVEGEWGRIEEITRSYVVIKIWDERRLIVPLQYFIENPFQNWTRGSANILGTVFLWVDYRMPVDPLREELGKLCEMDPDWDHRVAIIHVTEATEKGIQLRVLMSSRDAARNFDLRCRVREGLIEFIQAHYPQCFPVTRAEINADDRRPHEAAPVVPAAPTTPATRGLQTQGRAFGPGTLS